MTTERCGATVLVRPYGEVTCEKDAGHNGRHHANIAGEWKAVTWTDDTTAVLRPGWRRRK